MCEFVCVWLCVCLSVRVCVYTVCACLTVFIKCFLPHICSTLFDIVSKTWLNSFELELVVMTNIWHKIHCFPSHNLCSFSFGFHLLNTIWLLIKKCIAYEPQSHNVIYPQSLTSLVLTVSGLWCHRCLLTNPQLVSGEETYSTRRFRMEVRDMVSGDITSW